MACTARLQRLVCLSAAATRHARARHWSQRATQCCRQICTSVPDKQLGGDGGCRARESLPSLVPMVEPRSQSARPCCAASIWSARVLWLMRSCHQCPFPPTSTLNPDAQVHVSGAGAVGGQAHGGQRAQGRGAAQRRRQDRRPPAEARRQGRPQGGAEQSAFRTSLLLHVIWQADGREAAHRDAAVKIADRAPKHAGKAAC